MGARCSEAIVSKPKPRRGEMMARQRKTAARPVGEIMTVNLVAQYLRCDKVTVYKLIRRDKFPAFYLGSDWRFRRSDIDMWIAEHEVKPGKERRKR
jgi:excisionase family DNA binding protein